jgi:hypothetical protein
VNSGQCSPAIRTLDQVARALDSSRGIDSRSRGAPQAAHRRPYAIKTLEEQTDLASLDRRGYRTRLTAAGESVLAHARKLLVAERELEDAASGRSAPAAGSQTDLCLTGSSCVSRSGVAFAIG